MKRVEIQNFSGTQKVEIYSYLMGAPTVGVTQHSGSMNFQFDMTPDQARHMAAALIVHADAVEDEVAEKSTTPATV